MGGSTRSGAARFSYGAGSTCNGTARFNEESGSTDTGAVRFSEESGSTCKGTARFSIGSGSTRSGAARFTSGACYTDSSFFVNGSFVSSSGLTFRVVIPRVWLLPATSILREYAMLPEGQESAAISGLDVVFGALVIYI